MEKREDLVMAVASRLALVAAAVGVGEDLTCGLWTCRKRGERSHVV